MNDRSCRSDADRYIDTNQLVTFKPTPVNIIRKKHKQHELLKYNNDIMMNDYSYDNRMHNIMYLCCQILNN